MENPTTQTTTRAPFWQFWESLNVKDFGVYKLYDTEDRLLYVGMTCLLRRRMKQHYETFDWMRKTARVEFEHGFSEKEAREKEARYINELKPIHNIITPPTNDEPIERTGKLKDQERRSLILAVLRGESQASAARRYGVDRAHVLRLVRTATQADPDERIKNAKAEVAFWREIKNNLPCK